MLGSDPIYILLVDFNFCQNIPSTLNEFQPVKHNVTFTFATFSR
jgi:hypothetical protein